MLRSIFIGFLILSALTSKDVGAITSQNFSNISADILLELYNAAFTHADKQTGLSVEGSDGLRSSNEDESYGDALSNNSMYLSKAAIRNLTATAGDNTNAARQINYESSNILNKQISRLVLIQKQNSDEVIYTCLSDVSPPDFAVVL